MNVPDAPHSVQPVRLRISYRSPESLLQAFTKSVGKGGVSLPSQRPLERGTKFLFELTAGNQAFHARFAQATLMFDGSSGFLGGLLTRGEERLDIKKAGIFPLVHGTRALALERQLTETGTIARLRRLTEHGLFDKAHAQ